jgi:hypothetical protein
MDLELFKGASGVATQMKHRLSAIVTSICSRHWPAEPRERLTGFRQSEKRNPSKSSGG